jgi:hypothetical protein
MVHLVAFIFTNINMQHYIFGMDEEMTTHNDGRRNYISHISGWIDKPYNRAKFGIQFFKN